ncbi:MAG: hypothetical protein U0575_13370 [Phycisphaerales bacterium]
MRGAFGEESCSAPGRGGVAATVIEPSAAHFVVREPWRLWEHRRFGSFDIGILEVGGFGAVFEARGFAAEQFRASCSSPWRSPKRSARSAQRNKQRGSTQRAARPSARIVEQPLDSTRDDRPARDRPSCQPHHIFEGGVEVVAQLEDAPREVLACDGLVRDATPITTHAPDAARRRTAGIVSLVVQACDGVAHLHEQRLSRTAT